MVAVPAGPFLRGCDEGDRACQEDSQPKRTITLSAFEVDRLEVTSRTYRECVDAGGCEEPEFVFEDPEAFPPERANFHYDAPGREDTALNGVTWFQAETYCAWRGKRLPTSAEWEKAARGTDGRTFSWGEEAPNCTHGAFNALESGDCGLDNAYAAVGTHPAGDSPYGMADAAGGAGEWVSDWYDPAAYASDPDVDPVGPETGTSKVLRGGSWLSTETFIAVSNRIGGVGTTPDTANRIWGFRCARSVE
jgi:formylglycine-generating enzyme required for sulfatase activity